MLDITELRNIIVRAIAQMKKDDCDISIKVELSLDELKYIANLMGVIIHD